MLWRNRDGYYDPTAGEALKRIRKEERRKRREQLRNACTDSKKHEDRTTKER